jgi:hypothetical protein
MADTPPGMKINFDEQNMTKWEVLLDGPDQSVYTVRAKPLVSLCNMSISHNLAGRSLQVGNQFPK